MLILLITKALHMLRNRSDSGSTNLPAAAGTAPSARRARAEADEVRAMAASHMRHDPNFANELYAAAERHERIATEHA
jgi:hypothetical protein